jgi:hypothetical protein
MGRRLRACTRLSGPVKALTTRDYVRGISGPSTLLNKHLANDGVLRSLNAARDTVVDYVQLDKHQIAEYFVVIDKNASFMLGV